MWRTKRQISPLPVGTRCRFLPRFGFPRAAEAAQELPKLCENLYEEGRFLVYVT
ncbi:hypothetical protein AOX55_00003297 [Sinorhizobium fredii CCBAU 25509]|nr:hypothetical protein AOX55_00003297 [Sinorhizobium fredii CCBAU 25509]